MKSILSKDFRYVPSSKTDIRRTFARARKQLAEQQAERARDEQEAREKVATMRRAK